MNMIFALIQHARFGLLFVTIVAVFGCTVKPIELQYDVPGADGNIQDVTVVREASAGCSQATNYQYNPVYHPPKIYVNDRLLQVNSEEYDDIINRLYMPQRERDPGDHLYTFPVMGDYLTGIRPKS